MSGYNQCFIECCLVLISFQLVLIINAIKDIGKDKNNSKTEDTKKGDNEQ